MGCYLVDKYGLQAVVNGVCPLKSDDISFAAKRLNILQVLLLFVVSLMLEDKVRIFFFFSMILATISLVCMFLKHFSKLAP